VRWVVVAMAIATLFLYPPAEDIYLILLKINLVVSNNSFIFVVPIGTNFSKPIGDIMFKQNLKNDIFEAIVDCHNYGETELVNLLTKLQNANDYYTASNLAKEVEFASVRATNEDAKITVEVVLNKISDAFDALFDIAFGMVDYAPDFDYEPIPQDAYFDNMPHPELD